VSAARVDERPKRKRALRCGARRTRLRTQPGVALGRGRRNLDGRLPLRRSSRLVTAAPSVGCQAVVARRAALAQCGGWDAPARRRDASIQRRRLGLLRGCGRVSVRRVRSRAWRCQGSPPRAASSARPGAARRRRTASTHRSCHPRGEERPLLWRERHRQSSPACAPHASSSS
jgi:hypothetical protein